MRFSVDAKEKKRCHDIKDKIQVQGQKGKQFIQDGLEWDETKKDKLPCPHCSHCSVLIVNSDVKNKTATNLEAAMVYPQAKGAKQKGHKAKAANEEEPPAKKLKPRCSKFVSMCCVLHCANKCNGAGCSVHKDFADNNIDYLNKSGNCTCAICNYNCTAEFTHSMREFTHSMCDTMACSVYPNLAPEVAWMEPSKSVFE